MTHALQERLNAVRWEIMAGALAGDTALMLSERHGITPETMRRFLRQIGAPPAKRGPKPGKSRKATQPSERAQQAIAMRAEGKTQQQIGDALGITRQRVQQLLARWGKPSEPAA